MPKAADPDRIPVTSFSQLQSELNALLSWLQKDETEHSWEQIDKALKRFHAVVRGGSAKQYPEELCRGLRDKPVATGIIRCLISERTRLSGTALDLIAATTRLGAHFQPLASTYLPVVLRLLCRTNKLYIARASATVTSIILHTHLIDVLKFIALEWRAESGKSSSFREKAAEALSCILGCSTAASATVTGVNGLQVDKDALVKRIDELEWLIKVGATDREPKVRAEMKKCWEVYKVTWPERVASFTAPMTPVIRRYLNVAATASSAAATSTSATATRVAPIAKKPRVPSALSSSTSSGGPARSTAQASTSAASSARLAEVPAHRSIATTSGSLARPTASSSAKAGPSRHAPVVPASVPLPNSPPSKHAGLGLDNSSRQATAEIVSTRSVSASSVVSKPRDDVMTSRTANAKLSASVNERTVADDRLTSLAGMKLNATRPAHTSRRPLEVVESAATSSSSRPASRPFKPSVPAATLKTASSFMSSSMMSASGSSSSATAPLASTEHRKARRVLTTTTTTLASSSARGPPPFNATPSATPAATSHVLSSATAPVGPPSHSLARSASRSAVNAPPGQPPLPSTISTTTRKGAAPFRPQQHHRSAAVTAAAVSATSDGLATKRGVAGVGMATKSTPLVVAKVKEVAPVVVSDREEVQEKAQNESVKLVEEFGPDEDVKVVDDATNEASESVEVETVVKVEIEEIQEVVVVDGQDSERVREAHSPVVEMVQSQVVDDQVAAVVGIDNELEQTSQVSEEEEDEQEQSSPIESQELRAEFGMDTLELVSESQEQEFEKMSEQATLEKDKEVMNQVEVEEVEVEEAERETRSEVQNAELELREAADKEVLEMADGDEVESIRLIRSGMTPAPASPVASLSVPDAAEERLLTVPDESDQAEAAVVDLDNSKDAGITVQDVGAVADDETSLDADAEFDLVESAQEEAELDHANLSIENDEESTRVSAILAPVAEPTSAPATPFAHKTLSEIQHSQQAPPIVEHEIGSAWQESTDPDGDMDDFVQSCSIVLDTPPKVAFVRLPTRLLPSSLLPDELDNDEEQRLEHREVQPVDLEATAEEELEEDDVSDLEDVVEDETCAFKVESPLKGAYLADESTLQLVESSFDVVLNDVDVSREVEDPDDTADVAHHLDRESEESEIAMDDISVASDVTEVAEAVQADDMPDESSIIENASTMSEETVAAHMDETRDHEHHDQDSDVFELEYGQRELVFQDESVLSDESSIVDEHQYDRRQVFDVHHLARDSLSRVHKDQDEEDTGALSLRRSTRNQTMQEQQEDAPGSNVLKRSLRSRVVTVDLNSSTGTTSGKGVLTRSTRSNSRDVLSELQI
ncbi:hypothetical protein ACM66B_003992 [Microbotryomycetes sp. NB124-2]